MTLAANSLVFCVLFVALIACSAGQVLHGYARVVHSSSNVRLVTLLYEIALLMHIAVMASFALCHAGPAPDESVHFLYSSIPVMPALWVNLAVAFVAGYAVLAGIADDDELAGLVDFSWMPPVDAIISLLCTPAAAWALGESWLYVLLLDAAYFLFRTCAALFVDKRLRGILVSSLSIAEAMKLLPEGLLYADAHGRTLVANDAMRHCLSALGLSADFGRVDELWAKLSELAAGPNNVKVAESVKRETGDWVMLRIGPREVRLFSFEGSGFEQDRSYPSPRPLGNGELALGESRRLLGGEARMRVIAYDMTDEIEMMQAIDRANAELADSQRELQASLDTVQEAAENEAMLRMRGRVHDVIGQRLSMLHRALEDDDLSDAKLDQLKPLLNGILDDLAASSHIEPADELAATVNAFALTGVSVQVEGELPADEPTAKLFADCIREGATNAVKHAHATLVRASCAPGSLTVTNDGAAPEGPIVEGTGLAHMRQAVEAAGGTFEVERSPFALRITM